MIGVKKFTEKLGSLAPIPMSQPEARRSAMRPVTLFYWQAHLMSKRQEPSLPITDGPKNVAHSR